MGQITKDLIHQLSQGGEPARASLFRVSELLRKVFSTGFQPCFPELVHEKPTNAEISSLIAGLADYYETESLASKRREAVRVLACDTEIDVKDKLVRELHLALSVHRQISGDLYQLLFALERSGERVYDEDKSGRCIGEVQENVDAAANYLLGHGIRVPY